MTTRQLYNAMLVVKQELGYKLDTDDPERDKELFTDKMEGWTKALAGENTTPTAAELDCLKWRLVARCDYFPTCKRFIDELRELRAEMNSKKPPPVVPEVEINHEENKRGLRIVREKMEG